MADEENGSTGASTTEPEETTPPAGEGAEDTQNPPPAGEGQPAVDLVDDKFEFAVSKDNDVDKEALAGFKAFSVENKLPTKIAQSVLDHLIISRSKSEEAQKTANAETVKKNQETIKEDPDIGGSNYETVQSAVDKITLKYGGEDFKTKVIDAGLKNDSAFLRFIRNLNSVLTEDKTITTSQSKSTQPVEKTYQQIADNFFKK